MKELLPLLFVLLAIALILGPIMMLQPTSGQKKRAKLRALAAARGIKVQSDSDTSVMNYFLPWPDSVEYGHAWRLAKQNFPHGAHFFNEWDFAGAKVHFSRSEQEKLTSILVDLDWITEVGANVIGIYVRWDERLGDLVPESGIDRIEHLLNQLRGVFSDSGG